jgi:hypothetical protein
MFENSDEWLTPECAAERMSELCGYIVLPMDIRQLKRTGKLPEGSYRQVTKKLFFYKRSAIEHTKAPDKRKKIPYTKLENG